MSVSRGLLLPLGETFPGPDAVTPPTPSLGDWGFNVPAPSTLGSNIRPYLTQPGGATAIDNVICVAGDDPNNPTVYNAGLVSSAAQHLTSTGPTDGWLIVLPEVPYGATIDGDFDEMWADSIPQMRIVLAGFNFTNITVRLTGNSSHLRLWYPYMTFPGSAWETQYAAAGGTPGTPVNAIRSQTANFTPTPVRLVGSSASNTVNNFGIYGFDIDGAGDDGMFTTKAHTVDLVGGRVWEVDGQFDLPAYGPQGSNWWHSDGLQLTDQTDATKSINVTSCSIGRHWQVGGLAGPSLLGLNVTDCWTYWPDLDVGNPRGWFLNSGYLNGTPRKISGLFSGSNRYFDADLARAVVPAIYEQIKMADGTQPGRRWPTEARFTDLPTRIDMPGEDTVTVALPSGITPTGNTISHTAVNASVLNPANIWRAANPIESLFDYFGWDTP